MGFRLRNQGLQIILDRELAPFVAARCVGRSWRASWPRAASQRADVTRWILHPGGRRIIEVMAEQLGPGRRATSRPPRRCSREHGNMSSVTVLFVLDEILRAPAACAAARRGVLGAFGPGFGAEFALLEFC